MGGGGRRGGGTGVRLEGNRDSMDQFVEAALNADAKLGCHDTLRALHETGGGRPNGIGERKTRLIPRGSATRVVLPESGRGKGGKEWGRGVGKASGGEVAADGGALLQHGNLPDEAAEGLAYHDGANGAVGLQKGDELAAGVEGADGVGDVAVGDGLDRTEEGGDLHLAQDDVVIEDKAVVFHAPPGGAMGRAGARAVEDLDEGVGADREGEGGCKRGRQGGAGGRVEALELVEGSLVRRGHGGLLEQPRGLGVEALLDEERGFLGPRRVGERKAGPILAIADLRPQCGPVPSEEALTAFLVDGLGLGIFPAPAHGPHEDSGGEEVNPPPILALWDMLGADAHHGDGDGVAQDRGHHVRGPLANGGVLEAGEVGERDGPEPGGAVKGPLAVGEGGEGEAGERRGATATATTAATTTTATTATTTTTAATATTTTTTTTAAPTRGEGRDDGTGRGGRSNRGDRCKERIWDGLGSSRWGLTGSISVWGGPTRQGANSWAGPRAHPPKPESGGALVAGMRAYVEADGAVDVGVLAARAGADGVGEVVDVVGGVLREALGGRVGGAEV